ncbi:ATP-binding cassette domain-containing protein [Mycolicibacterium goodii]|uniref:ABC transporter n=1 Tax=Mycolicibacterium goodii TaxID=134601 RepID=A0A0K0XB30_MYCGD|nr:ABC transporter [Mycolicibacterium goodii]
MTATITATGLSKRFDRTEVLRGAEIFATGGHLTLVEGAPGSGRTTLARCLTGVYRPDGGTVSLGLGGRGSVDLTAADARTVAWLRARTLAAFDGAPAAAPTLTAAAAVARAAGCTHTAAVAGLTRLGAGTHAHLPLGRLRTDGRHRVALAAAMLACRPFVVLDEPERHAPATVLTDWLRQLTESGAAVVVTAACGSSLTAIASAVGELREGEIEWHTT